MVRPILRVDLRRAVQALLAILIALLPPGAARGACRDWNPLDNWQATRARPVAAADLIQLVNFGRPDAEPIGGPSPLAISPDGRRIAFILQRADLAANDYCQALVMIDLAGRDAPRILDRGGHFLMTDVVLRGIQAPNGFPRLNAPAWSHDGRALAYLRRDDGPVQLWRVQVDGGQPAPVTHAPVDVDAWAWAPDGQSLLYASAPARLAAEQAIDREGRMGWHYDGRTLPPLGPRPQPQAPLPRTVALVDPRSGIIVEGGEGAERQLARVGDAPLDRRIANPRGDIAWAERTGPSPLAPRRVRARDRRGMPWSCRSDACSGAITGLWWDADGRRLVFLRSEGWNGRFSALYRWAPGQGQPRALLRTDDWVAGCRPARGIFVCIREGAAKPPRLVAIDLAGGTERTLFDPNPSFGILELGSVRRLEWRNDLGREVYGDLVLPPGYRGGSALPAVVVQYSSRGFLRGGTGSEYPIYLLAARNFAVLSIHKPSFFAAAFPSLKTFDEISQVDDRDWAERRNVHSAIARGVALLVSKGIADPARIGITGLSDGASAVRFALGTSRLFAAAAISTCCVDESSDILEGPAWADYSARIGYPPAQPVDTAFWRPYSLALNADHIDTPLLMQLADTELLTALPAFTALRAYGQPADLYVFPNEFHIRWQPQHRQATFERSLDWFAFWLQGETDPAPAKAAQFERWRGLRAARDRADRTPMAAASGP